MPTEVIFLCVKLLQVKYEIACHCSTVRTVIKIQYVARFYTLKKIYIVVTTLCGADIMLLQSTFSILYNCAELFLVQYSLYHSLEKFQCSISRAV